MAARFGVFCLAFLLGSLLTRESPAELIVWNVGQGQWATIVDDEACWHIDMGGEFAPWRQIRQLCRQRQNRISLSHWDMDHIVFVGGARAQLPDLCLINAPWGPATEAKERLLLNLPRCQIPSPYAQWSNPEGKTANAKSWVVLWRGVLAPGDSPREQEKIWVHRLQGLDSTRYLILGHHGSRTSTSMDLLAHLPHVELAISSARYRRYRHPHPEVVRELRQARIPLLRTEEWGTIHLRLD
jgi:competence protein ComEC